MNVVIVVVVGILIAVLISWRIIKNENKKTQPFEKDTPVKNDAPVVRENASSTYGGTFYAPDERAVATIGTGYLANFIATRSTRRAGATLTNKRIYFSGEIFFFNGRGGISSTKQQEVVNVRDVTGTGYVLYRPLSILLMGILAILVAIFLFIANSGADGAMGIAAVSAVVIGIALVDSFYISCKTLLSIKYAGGAIAFDVRWLNQHEQDNFIRDIHLVKDKCYSNAAAEQGFHD